MKFNSFDKLDWKSYTLGELAEEITIRVDNPAKSQFNRFVGLEHFVSGEIKISKWSSTSNVTSSAKEFKAGDVLFARRNAYLKRASMVDFDGVCSGDAFVLRENSHKLTPGFLAFIVNSNSLWDFANANAAGTMSKRVKWRDLKSYTLRIPPKKEQENIIELFKEIDNVTEKDSQLYKHLTICLDSLRNAIFSKKSVHPKNVYQCDALNEVNLGFLYSVKSQNGIYKPKEFQGRGVRIINMGEIFAFPVIKDEEMSLIELNEKELSTYLVEEGDLIFARRSLVVEGAGKCSIVGKHSSPMTFESSMIRVRLDKEKINSKFVYHFLRSKEGRKLIRRIVGFTTVAGITSTDLAKVVIPLIPLKRQNEIVEILDNFDAPLHFVEESKRQSRKLHSSLINQVF